MADTHQVQEAIVQPGPRSGTHSTTGVGAVGDPDIVQDDRFWRLAIYDKGHGPSLITEHGNDSGQEKGDYAPEALGGPVHHLAHSRSHAHLRLVHKVAN